ncbi:hypothetical protein WME89_13355 [Sorangium sp. So ce321]|uniref:hypothetical protein n=1 Tax=Sorangium sp. So ce321 TaxID=3133300 RepID=UPI003F616CBE
MLPLTKWRTRTAQRVEPREGSERLEPPYAARLGGANLPATAVLWAHGEHLPADGWDEPEATRVAARRALHGGAGQALLAR